jgi:hypothetical protein
VSAVTAANNTAVFGGFAAVMQSSALNISGGSFHDSTVERGGWGGLLAASMIMTLKDCNISGGPRAELLDLLRRDVSGGALHIDNHAKLSLSGCTIADYSAKVGGGLVAFGNSSVQVQNCTWHNLTAWSSGGAVHLQSAVRSTWRGGTFSDTHAQSRGAVFVAQGSLDMADTAFVNATASDGGGAMYINQGAVNLTNCHFGSCSSDSLGGALGIADNANVRLLGCNLTRCATGGAGGAVSVAGTAIVDMDRCSLLHNYAVTFGGAVALTDSALVRAKHSSIVWNECEQKGGGLVAAEMSEVHFDNCIIFGNVATAGGGLCLLANPAGEAYLGLNSTLVMNNTATSYGGGVLLGSSRFSLPALREAVSNNHAPWDADISTLPFALSLFSSSAVHGFISRIKSDEGLWNATLLVTGPQALPSSNVIVVAWLDGVQLTQNKSGEDGLLDLHMKLRKPPGEMGISAV